MRAINFTPARRVAQAGDAAHQRAGRILPNRCTLLAAVNSPETVHGNVNRPAFQAVSGSFFRSFHR